MGSLCSCPPTIDQALLQMRGETVIDPEVVTAMLRAARDPDPIAAMSPREREVLALMAEGRSNAAISEALVLTERTVESHVRSIFTRLGLAPAADDHRRVLAVLAYLRSGGGRSA